MKDIGIRDRNGIMIHVGDTVKVVYWNKDWGEYTGTVNYDAANACYKIGTVAIHRMGRDRGTSLEVVEHLETDGAKPLKKRRKGNPS